MPQALDFANNLYLAVSLTPSSNYKSTPIILDPYSYVNDLGNVGELPDVKILSIPKDEGGNVVEDIVKILEGDKSNVLRVDRQEPKVRTKRGGDEL